MSNHHLTTFLLSMLGTEEANLKDGAHIHEMDLSKGYPIQLNDRTILLVASLSADVVPETQESQMESQDENPGGEGALEQDAAEPLYGCLKHQRYPLVDSVKLQEMEALGLPLNQDARYMNTEELNHQVEEHLKLKPLAIADQPSKSLSPEENDTVIEARKLYEGHDASCSGDSHNISMHGQKKKYRRRKVSQVLMQEDGRLAALNNDKQGVQGDDDAQIRMVKNAELMESPIETSNGKLGTCNEVNMGESSYKLDINMGASEDVSIRSRDPSSRLEMTERKVSRRKRQRQGVGSCHASSPSAGEHITEPKKVSIEPRFRNEDGGECMEGILIGGNNTTVQENLCEKERTGKRKKKKRRKELIRPICDHHNDAGINNTHSNCEVDPVYECAKIDSENDTRPSSRKENKELPNASGLAAIEENELKHGEVNLNNNAGSDDVAKKKSKRKKKVNTDTDLEMCFTQEQDQNVAHANVNDTESLSKDDIVKSSSPGSPSREPSEEGVIMTKQGCDVFEFESSETVNRQKENFTHLEATSSLEADNLDKLCSVAVNFVEDEMLNPSKTATRKTSRKIVHPKRWITVLSERLTWNQTSKSSSKKQRANKKNRLKTKGTLH